MEKNIPPVLRDAGIAGFLLVLAGMVALMGIITAEIFYPPGYSTADSELSDLGATRPPGSIITQPSATIFNMAMIIAGLLVLTSSLVLFRETHRWSTALFPALLGTGVLGVGLFPGNNAFIHPFFALLAFISGGLAAIWSARMVVGPLRCLFMVLGGISLIFLLLNPLFIPLLGDGGTERFIAYPVIIWMIGFGGYLAGSRQRING